MRREAYHIGVYVVGLVGAAGGAMGVYTFFIEGDALATVLFGGMLLYMSGKIGKELMNDAYNEESWYTGRKLEQSREARDELRQQLARYTDTLPARFEIVNDGEVALRPVENIDTSTGDSC